MRFQDSKNSRQIAKICLVLTTTTALAACGALGGGYSPPASTVSAVRSTNGPQADYPVLVGAPYTVADVEYVPAETLNYDEVGYLASTQGSGITGAHHTLPIPSYVEVTSLETGRTILVRLESRGPMNSTHLLALSPAAMEQLGGSDDEAVRVRRVNPPEEQRELLRTDQAAPERMDTPTSLVNVLRRDLPEEGSASVRTAAIAPQLPTIAPRVIPALPPIEAENDDFEDAFERPELAPAPRVQRPAPAPTPARVRQAPPLTSGFVVQAAAFSTEARAQRVANAIGGRVTQAGRFYRVRTGPFASRAEAEASLANVRAAGYSDARIYTVR